VDAAGVVGPRDPEDDLALGFAQALQNGALQEFRVTVVDGTKAFEDLNDGLVEFLLPRVPRQGLYPDGFQPCIHEFFLTWPARNGHVEGGAVPKSLRFNLSDYDCPPLGGQVRFS
jgi:hypothetical protein